MLMHQLMSPVDSIVCSKIGDTHLLHTTYECLRVTFLIHLCAYQFLVNPFRAGIIKTAEIGKIEERRWKSTFEGRTGTRLGEVRAC
jgi:hypothetical protein